MPNIDTKAIDYAITKFQNFVRVQKSQGTAERLTAFDCFAECVGIGSLEWEHLTDKLCDIVETTDDGAELGWTLIGILMGLYMREFHE